MGASFHSVMIVVLGIVILGLAAVVYQLIKQQGRILLRLDHLERLAEEEGKAVKGPVPDSLKSEPQGIPPGTPVAPFSLPDVSGRVVSLQEFRGRRILLVHWNPQCGFCDLIAPDLAQLQPDLHKRNIQLLLVSYGDREPNRKLAREHGLKCPILLMKDSQRLEAFRNEGTPVAYLLDEEARVARALAEGAQQVLALAREAAGGVLKSKRLLRMRPLSESRIEREGLKPGAVAPTFRLPDIHGCSVSLEDYRGRSVLLVFTQPGCGPCDQLAPHLVRLHQDYGENGLAVLVVGRGDQEENRHKAEQHGFEFPVVVQERWKLSKAYGTFATPVAFLIEENGIIAGNAAVGTDAILSLAREAVTRHARPAHSSA